MLIKSPSCICLTGLAGRHSFPKTQQGSHGTLELARLNIISLAGMGFCVLLCIKHEQDIRF